METPSAPLGARIAAVVAAVAWGFFFFGLIDLLVVVIQDDRFYDYYLLETGWGLLYTVLVAFPLGTFAFRPRSQVLLQQVVVVAACVLVCAVVTPAMAQIIPAVLLASTALLLSVWSGHGLWPIRGLSIRRVDRGLGALVLVAAAAAVLYAVQMIQAARAGEPDDDTWWLMHLPMQAAFGLAVAGSAAVSVLARAANAQGWQVSAVPALVSAGWLGAVSFAYPEHLGSLGRVAGVAAMAWGVAFAAGMLIPHGGMRRVRAR
jgi:hypothetical protein